MRAEARRPEIAVLTPADWKLYRELRLRALADAPEAFGSTLERESSREPDEWQARLANRIQWVARIGHRVVGTVGAIGGDGETLELVSMWVEPDARGSGVADALVDAVLRRARIDGTPYVSLWVSQGNDRAEQLYARHGFVRTGATQPIHDNDPTRRELEMRADLG
jgi:GNAT superfamily N-acetyltransferase